ncbi:serine/threonine-protein kinase [Gemmata sp. JC717]|nr:serine/threonine-protein kinase [Gemmata algarum]MDY3555187.1 serine/threonine-protein kinase [Gemmata algarum]
MPIPLTAGTETGAPEPLASLPAPDSPPPPVNAGEDTTDPAAPIVVNRGPGNTPQLPQIPGYVVEKFVASGGTGVVFRARHLATDRLVALKLISPRGAGDEIAHERFLREIRTLARIKHPNVVPVYDAGNWHGFPYCTMQFVAQGTLGQHLERFRRDQRGAVGLLVKVARGVQALHDQGIIHRDLKPLNILIGPDDEPLVADFGLAKCLGDESDLTLTALPLGTRMYMAPEQTLGRRQDYKAPCDVWALGVTLYEVLTGHRPFADDGHHDVYHVIRTAQPVPPAALSADVPAALQAIVLKCLAKRPEGRYPTAAELADDLDRWLRDEPVRALLESQAKESSRQATLPQKLLPRWRSRRALTAAAVALVAVTMTAALLLQKPPQNAAPREPTFAERIAAGGPVALTDDTGLPLIEPVNEPEHALMRDTIDGYVKFSHTGTGMANILDQKLPADYRVEALIGTTFNNTVNARAGIYVGRRLWEGLPFKHESFFTATIGPESVKAERRLVSTFEKYWWARHENGGVSHHLRATKPWHPENKNETLRFAPVRIDVRGDTLEVSVDGHPVRSLTAETIARDVNSTVQIQHLKGRLPEYTCEAPYLGNGIGIFCHSCECVVRNLTVTKLAPNP